MSEDSFFQKERLMTKLFITDKVLNVLETFIEYLWTRGNI